MKHHLGLPGRAGVTALFPHPPAPPPATNCRLGGLGHPRKTPPVFSQFSSSLLSAQSSSPSQRQDRRTQRPDRQRNCSAVHIEVAGQSKGRMKGWPEASPCHPQLYFLSCHSSQHLCHSWSMWHLCVNWKKRCPFLKAFYCYKWDIYYVTSIPLDTLPLQCATYITLHGGPIQYVFELYW